MNETRLVRKRNFCKAMMPDVRSGKVVEKGAVFNQPRFSKNLA